MVVTASNLSGQHFIGLKGGMGGGSIRLNPTTEQNTMWGLPSFSLQYQYIGGDYIFGGIEVDLNYTQKGYITLPRMDSDTSYRRKVNTIELPFLWHPYVDMFKNKFRLFLNAGPYLAYNISSSYETVSQERGVLESGDYEWDPLRDNRLEYGLMGGAGFSLQITKNIDILGEFRYTLGFSDLLKNPNKYSGNPYESPLSLMSVLVGVSYKIGGGKSKRKKIDRALKETHQEMINAGITPQDGQERKEEDQKVADPQEEATLPEEATAQEEIIKESERQE